MAVGKNIMWKEGKGKQYHIPYNVKAVGKNIKLGREEGDGDWERKSSLKKGRGYCIH